MAQNTAPAQTTALVPSNVAPLPTPASRTPELNALLGKGSQFEGKLIFEGTVRIDGKFSGEIISTDQLIIGEGAEVKANVKVGTLTCLGDYQGRYVDDIDADKPRNEITHEVKAAPLHGIGETSPY